jgi:hypothetical protein
MSVPRPRPAWGEGDVPNRLYVCWMKQIFIVPLALVCCQPPHTHSHTPKEEQKLGTSFQSQQPLGGTTHSNTLWDALGAGPESEEGAGAGRTV